MTAARVSNSWLLLLIGLSATVAAAPVECRSTKMSFDRQKSAIVVGNYIVRLGGADSDADPTVWEGPIHVGDRLHSKTCSLRPEGLIDRPLFAFDGHFLVLVTMSGSNFMVATINLRDCTITSTPKTTGPVTFEDGRVLAHGKAVIDFLCKEVR